METFNKQRKRSRADALEGETMLIGDTYKTCKINFVKIDGEFYPAWWNSVDGWTYYNFYTEERKLVPDSVEILCEWN